MINYDCPNDAETYIHRIGRTARGNKKGKSYTFLSDEDVNVARNLMKQLELAGQQNEALNQFVNGK